jgi:peptidyl-tRNA hydrolase, PTH1 family
MKLIVGLGNPEPKYMTTRHNAGFWVVEKIATKYGAGFNRQSNLNADVCKTSIEGLPAVLAKPLTYMNLSGRAVQSILHWYKIAVEDCIIVHDDVSLPLGKIRFQQGGGAGGQHGIESIIEMLGGNKGFDRLKFGVGPDPGGDRRADYVLSAVPDWDRDLRDQMISLAADGLLLWLCNGLKTASNKYNGMDLRPKPAQPEPPIKPAPVETSREGGASPSVENPATSSLNELMGTIGEIGHLDLVADASPETAIPESTKPIKGVVELDLNEMTIISDDSAALEATAAEEDFASEEDEELDALPPPEF